MSYVLTHFMSPLGIMRFRFIVAVTATTLAFAFAFVASIVLGVCLERSMLTTVQVYIEALIAFALVSTLSIIAGFIAAGVTGERTFGFAAAFISFATSGAVLAVRLWRMANRTA